MIFITVGTQKFQFDRLLKKVDELVGEGQINEQIIAQIGHSNYVPQNYSYYKFINKIEMDSYYRNCEVLIAHGGTNSIIQGLKSNKKVIAVPRMSKYGEHVDDHQFEICRELAEEGYLEYVEEIELLGNLLSLCREREYKDYNFDNGDIINSINQYVKKVLEGN